MFEPNSKYSIEVTPANHGKGRPRPEGEERTSEQHHQAMIWAQRLKRMCSIDVSICPKCGGEDKVTIGIEDKVVIGNILQRLQAKGALPSPTELLPATRASPTSDWFA